MLGQPGELTHVPIDRHASDLDKAWQAAVNCVAVTARLREWADVAPEQASEFEAESGIVPRREVATLLGLFPVAQFLIGQVEEELAEAFETIETFAGLDAPSHHVTALHLAYYTLAAASAAMSVGIMVSGDGCTEPCEFAMYGFGHAFRRPETLVRLREFLRTIPPFKGQRLTALIYKELARAKGARSKRQHSPTPAKSESKTRAEGLLRQFESVFRVDECGGDIDQAAARLGRNPDTVKRECEAGREWLRKLEARLEGSSARGQSAGSAQDGASAGMPAGEAREGGGKDPEVALESLPTDSPPGDAERDEVKPVVLRGKNEKPIVRGREKELLTPARYDVVEAVLKAGQSGLTKDQMDKQSRHTDARKLLKKVAELDEDWGAVIHMAGITGGRYRIG